MTIRRIRVAASGVMCLAAVVILESGSTSAAPQGSPVPNPNLQVHELKIEKMTAESFRPFGELFDAPNRPADRRIIAPDKGWEIKGKTVVAVIWQPALGMTFTQLERHFDVTQAFVPIDGPPSVVAVAEPTDLKNPEAVPRPDQVHAFLIDGTVGFRYKIGTWHSLNRHILYPPGATFLMLNVTPNPSEVVDYDKKFGVMFKIVL